MSTAHCPKCLQFVSPLRPHRCPCDRWEHRRDAFRRRQARHHAATALVLLAAALGLLYVANVPEPRLPSAVPLEAAGTPVAPGSPSESSVAADPGSPAVSGIDTASASILPVASPMTEPSADGYGSGTPVESMPAPDTATILAGGTTRQGTLSYVGKRFGRLYLALPDPRGTVARICGPGGCVTRTSTDYGPDQRVNPDRVADLSAWDWETVCAVPLAYGLCSGTVTILERPRLTAPPTDEEMP